MWRWLLALALAGCIYRPQKLTPGDSAGDPALPRLETWTDLGGSSVGPRDAPLKTSAHGGGVSGSPAGARLPDVIATDTATVVAWQDEIGGTSTIHVRRFADNIWSSYDARGDGYVDDGTRPSLALEAGGKPVVAYESGESIAVRIYEGSSWQPYGDSLHITDPVAEAASQPSLAVGPLGAIVAYRTGSAGTPPSASTSIRVRRHETGWTTMPGAPLQVDGSERGDHPDLALMPSGAPVVVWDADQFDGDGTRDVRLRRLENTAWNILSGQSDLNETLGSATEPAVAVSPDDRIAVAWLDTTPPGSPAVYLRVRNPGVNWDEIEGSASGGGVGTSHALSAPDVAFPGEENFNAPIVSYISDEYEVRVRTPGRNNASGWVGPTHPFYPYDGTVSWPGRDSATPSIALIPTSGRPVVVWTDETAPAQIYVKRYTCLTMWEPLVESADTGVSDAATCAEAPSLRLDRYATPTIAWQTWDAGYANWEIFLGHWTGERWIELDGSTTGGGVSATTIPWWDSGWPSLDLDNDSQPWVAWAEYLPTGHGERWTVYGRAFDTGSWGELDSSASNDGISPSGSNTFPSLAFERSGSAWVAYVRDEMSIVLAHWDGSAWTELTGPSPSGSSGPVGRPSLALDSTGAPVLAWFRRNDSNGHMVVYVHRYNGSNWRGLGGGESVVAGGTIWASNPSLALDGSDNPVVAFQETIGTVWNIHVSRFNGGTWARVGGGIGTATRASREPNLALDGAGRPVVAWAEATYTNFEIYLRRHDGNSWAEIDGSSSAGGISNTHADSRYPSLDISQDRACVAWTDAGPAGLQVAARCIDLPLE